MTISALLSPQRPFRFRVNLGEEDTHYCRIPEMPGEAEFPGEVTLSTDDNKVWTMSLVDDYLGWRLERGWSNFREYYRLVDEDTVAFSFNRVSHFHAMIYEKYSGIERILFPTEAVPACSSEATIQCSQPRGDHLHSEETELVHDTDGSSSATEGSREPLTREQKNMRDKMVNVAGALFTNESLNNKAPGISIRPSPTVKSLFGMREDNSQDTEGGSCSKVNKMRKIDIDYTGTSSGGLVFKGESLELRTDANFFPVLTTHQFYRGILKGSVPPHLSVVMLKSYVSVTYTMNLPISWARVHLQEGKTKVNLSVYCEDGTWEVTCTRNYEKARIAKGWKKFVEANALEVNDVCIFHIARDDPKAWTVSLNRFYQRNLRL